MGMSEFYAAVPLFDAFASVADPLRYRPLPNDWLIGVTDVVASTKAIALGDYKRVNTAGAAVIAALSNALDGLDFPFVFGGDGASFAVGPEHAETATRALAETAALVRDEFGLELRAAALRVADIRRAGHDVRVARYAASENVHYAMFMGGGLAWAERELKAGRFAVPPAPVGSRPDLTGLSCRWAAIPSTRGVVLSLIVQPAGQGMDEEFHALVLDVLRIAGEGNRPVPDGGPPLAFDPSGIPLEARLRRKSAGLWQRVRMTIETYLGWFVIRHGIRIGEFDPVRYRRETAQNSDFRKYDDGLRMTLDCTEALADAIEARLAAAETGGIAVFGVHRQKGALMTCVVPSVMRSDHVHFIDGAAGGYAAAARAMKEKMVKRFPFRIREFADEVPRRGETRRA